ncbi:lytic murein transglycosylase [Parvularcula sp. ZS-1/3]|uniref:Lytic murein transglycosylase n=1 Tax=Parvularcula mediterranea TaxID=2732508 RepID=A0A7Y3RN64_9PROT|nr:lytic murein transglycosylase [Parvularcula mediterranea]NNU16725.1 lytic murein transglycosylase [Parvularcula mediterranea]
MLFAALAALTLSVSAAQESELDAFVRDFRAEALSEGISPTVYDREMATATVRPKVIERDRNQPEFVRPIWGYLDSAVSDRRISDGRAAAVRGQDPLIMAATAYGTDPNIIAAIWGLESNYGKILGNNDIISAVTTLAIDGRRERFAKAQLIAALRIIQDGYATREQLVGSWAGAMGQTQFIPTTYLAYAVDLDGDGKKNIWTDLGDVFASTANHLDRSGWRTGRPVVVEVTLPDDFNYALTDGRRLRVVDWIQNGVRGASSVLLDVADPDLGAKLIVPAGAKGPAFLTFHNFDVIKRYNNATSYALGVAMLAERIGGSETGLKAEWPRDDRPLTRTERMELQRLLAAKGFSVGGIDGIIGPNTRKALRQWQAANGLTPDGYPSASMLAKLSGNE